MEFPTRLVNADLMISASCNLDCEYCFISKNDKLKEIDKKIIKELESGDIVSKLEEYYDEELKNIALWGSETTLFLEKFTPLVPEILDKFKEVEKISISSNFYAKSSIDKLLDLARMINKESGKRDREITFKLQISIDGPEWITDSSRKNLDGEGITDHILENIERLNNAIEEFDFKDKFIWTINFKSTVSSPFIKKMVDNELIIDYFEFFDEIGDVIESTEDDVEWSINSSTPTIVVPGSYSTEDAKYYTKFLDELFNIIKSGREYKHYDMFRTIPYLIILKKVFFTQELVEEQNRGLACGAGAYGHSISYDDYSHLCHRAYLMEDDKYLEILKSNFDDKISDLHDLYADKHVVSAEDEFDFTRQQYMINAYRDYVQSRINHNYSVIKLLAKSGQADPIYLEDDELAEFASMFIAKTMSCVVEAILNTGSGHTTPVQSIRFWVNGAFQKLIEIYNELSRMGVI